MFMRGHIKRSVESFAAQFEESNGRIVYRKGSKGAPIEVTAEERAEFIARFERDMRRLLVVGVAASSRSTGPRGRFSPSRPSQPSAGSSVAAADAASIASAPSSS